MIIFLCDISITSGNEISIYILERLKFPLGSLSLEVCIRSEVITGAFVRMIQAGWYNLTSALNNCAEKAQAHTSK